MPVTHIAPELRLFAGPDVLTRLPRELQRQGARRALVVCGRSMSASPHLETVKQSLGSALAGVYPGVKAHSPVSAAAGAADALAGHQADAIVALGGGSAAVTARAAAIFLAEGRDLSRIATHRDAAGKMISPRLSRPKLPIFNLPTTPTTAVVKAGTAVFDPDSHRRFALFDPKTRASAILLDPALLASSPAGLARTAALDALAVAVDGLLSRRGDAIADALLIHAVRLLTTHLERLTDDDGPALRETLSMAAVLSGRGTDLTGTGLTTVLGHAIGARHQVDNGTVKAILLPHTVRFVLDQNPKGAANLTLALGTASQAAIPDRLHSLTTSLGIPPSLSEIGLASADLPAIAERAMGDWFLKDSPRKIDGTRDIVTLLADAL